MAPHVVPSTPDQTSSKDSLLFSSDSLEKKAKARQRQAEIMAKMRAEQSKFAESMKSSVNEGHDVLMSESDVSSSTGAMSEESLPVCSLCRESDSKSPLCYLILLQKSRLATFVEMDGMTSLEDIEADIYNSIVNNLSGSNNVAIQDGEETLSSSTSNVTVGSKKIRSPKCSILGTYVSCLSAKHRQSSLYDVASRASASIFVLLKQRYIRRLGFEGGHIVDPDLGELLCPVCRRFANSILPASPNFSTSSLVAPSVQTMSAEDVTSTSDMDINSLQFPRALALLENAGKVVGQSNFLKALSGRLNHTTEPSLDPSLRRLTMLYYPRNHSSFSASERLSPSLFLWDTLKYSLVSTEIASRGRMSSHSSESKSCLESLRSELNSSSGFILSLLFRVAHSARNLNRLELLLRFEGIQLLAGSICSCVSGYKDILSATKRKGTLWTLQSPFHIFLAS
ncbi:hypothetical protein PR202_gb26448 [Eleusine coracana subsp. coracana]|uniref:E3 ubiquitin-protein ligase n=1 Tax=Eleusine coracana subsp. coracana TaxID=191504 RepID=A0AAV5FRJ2_ELECO|nr:hypothetical protein PR202_gb26448 [Eleusine coracana subsp. coracana]